MAANLMSLNTSSSFFPPATRQLLGGNIQQALQQTSLFGQSPLLGGGSGLNGFSGKSNNPFNLLGNGSLNNIDPFTAVSLATAIGGLPPRAQSNRQSPTAALLGSDNLNNINPMNAVALATALAGPLLASRQGGGMPNLGGLLA